MIGSLADKIAKAMADSDRTWTASEIARAFLKLTQTGPTTTALVRGLLAPDARFHEAGEGSWSIHARAEPPLLQAPLWLAQVETGSDAGVWRMHVRLWERGRSHLLVHTLVPELSQPWLDLRRQVAAPVLATFQPALVTRTAGWMDRSEAIGEWEVLDLSAWAKIALVGEGVPTAELAQAGRVPALADRWSLGPIREGEIGALETLSALVDKLDQRYPGWTAEDLSRARAAVLEPRPVDFARFSFTRADLEDVPITSGVYRFRDALGGLLYVGKAASLATRLGSYFRPLPLERTKREELLESLRSFEIELCASELEALILESRAIRAELPRWNVQVAVRRPESVPEEHRWPLVFVPRAISAEPRTVLILNSADDGFLLRLPGRAALPPQTIDGRWLEPLLGRAPGSETGKELELPVSHLWLDSEEVWLALRYFARQGDRVDRCEGWGTVAELWEQLLCLVDSAPRPGDGALLQRS